MSIKVDRRDFLKNAAVAGTAVVGANGMLGAGLPAAEETEATGTDSAAGVATSQWGTIGDDGVFTPSFLLDPEPIPDNQIKEVYDAEIVVVGMGLAGMSAAREAIEEGADVFVIEKGETHHVHSHQFHAINSQALKDAGYELSDEEIDFLVEQVMHDHRERMDRRIWSYLFHH